MASNIPNWKERQKLIDPRNKKSNSAGLSAIAKECVAQGRLQEALDYSFAAKDQDMLAKLEQIAVDEGDAFILAGMERLTAIQRSTDVWNKLGYKAMELGKYAFARRAFERTANELMLAKISGFLGEAPLPAAPHDSQP